jgi:transposase
LSPGQAHDAPVGRELLKRLGIDNLKIPLIMDRTYEGNESRDLVQSLGFEPAVPPLQARRDPWSFDAELYERRNEIERLFGRIKRFRRVFTRYDKTDLVISAFVTVAFIADQRR